MADEPHEPRPVAFFDRDGVINIDVGYLHKPEDCLWVEGAHEAIRLVKELGFFVAIVTNQAGIAKGLYTESDYLRFTDWFKESLLSQGAKVDEILHCPHHPEAPDPRYRLECECRKPKPGMLNRTLARPQLRREGSFLIGDRQTDLEAAEAAEIPGYLFQGGNLVSFVKQVVHECRDRFGRS